MPGSVEDGLEAQISDLSLHDRRGIDQALYEGSVQGEPCRDGRQRFRFVTHDIPLSYLASHDEHQALPWRWIFPTIIDSIHDCRKTSGFYFCMASAAGGIEALEVGRNVIRVAGWFASSPVPGTIDVRVGDVPADAVIFPDVSLGPRRLSFVGHVRGVDPAHLRWLKIVGPDGSVIVATAATRVHRLQPRGFIDRATPEAVTGWLDDPDLMPGERSELVIDGLPAIVVTPLVDRQDVVAAGISPHPLVGFEVSLLPPVARVAARVAASVGGKMRQAHLLSRGLLVAAAPIRLERRLAGEAVISDGREIRGWVRDLDGVPGPICIDLAIDGKAVLRLQTKDAPVVDGDHTAVYPFERRLPDDLLHPWGRVTLVRPQDALAIAPVVVASCGSTPPMPGDDAFERFSRRGERPRILSLIASTGGGTPMTNFDLMRGLEAEYEPFILSAAVDRLRLDRIVGGQAETIAEWLPAEPIDPERHDSDSYRTVIDTVLERLGISLVHVRHLAWHGLSMFERAEALGIPVVVSLHDYYAACPTVKLLDEFGRHCGGVCTPGRGPCRPELWPPQTFQPLKHARVTRWRAVMTAALSRASHLITTSPAARDLLLQNLPSLRRLPFDVIPHGRDFKSFRQAASPPRRGDKLKVLALGSIAPSKGAHVLAALAQDPRLELHILGDAAPFLAVPGIIHHGTYDRESVLDRICHVGPHVGLIASTWPETYCHTLTELWAAGVPVVAFGLGAVGERLDETGAGWYVTPNSTLEMARTLHRLGDNPDEVSAAIAKVRALQSGELAVRTTFDMTEHYACIYRRLIKSSSSGESLDD